MVLATAAALVGPTNAGAAPVITGDLKCSIGATQMRFDPPLVLLAGNTNPTKSRDTFAATLSACRGSTAATPAPAGIHHGLIELKGRLKHNSCEDLAAVPGYGGTSLYGPQRRAADLVRRRRQPDRAGSLRGRGAQPDPELRPWRVPLAVEPDRDDPVQRDAAISGAGVRRRARRDRDPPRPHGIQRPLCSRTGRGHPAAGRRDHRSAIRTKGRPSDPWSRPGSRIS